MSINCIRCVVRDRTGTDLLCDACRAVKKEEVAQDYPHVELCRCPCGNRFYSCDQLLCITCALGKKRSGAA